MKELSKIKNVSELITYMHKNMREDECERVRVRVKEYYDSNTALGTLPKESELVRLYREAIESIMLRSEDDGSLSHGEVAYRTVNYIGNYTRRFGSPKKLNAKEKQRLESAKTEGLSALPRLGYGQGRKLPKSKRV